MNTDMKKETAVEYMFRLLDVLTFEKDNETQDIFNDILEQAKAMEKEQMEEAVSNGISKADMVDNRGYFNFDKWYNETYGANNYDAWDEVIDQLGETNKMIDHIGEVNKMVNHVPDVGKMVEDVEKLAEKYPYGGREGSKRLAFIDGYNTAKETLFTEEQVREVIRNCFKSNAIGFLLTEDDMMRTIKQSK